MKYEDIKKEIELENLQDDNIMLKVLNDIFRVYEFDNSTYSNNTIIRAVLQGEKETKYFIISNNNLLQIKKIGKYFDYQINGNTGKNTKFIKELELPFARNSTTKILERI